ncbi:putative FeS assembly SUF system protein SufT [Candidatus Endolissoclinum faulkneri L5]|uniref:Putative FeS assembly SUF system protein SufT n=1 Tax=Candidatus Endolissoclinum faulkneri L5 TaxID=1401328 RepID=V9TUT3_9PROT|nr:iron-sulfur cluster assembly protein [Candidatus Endolissoclinum faulkneri]AHC73917.1 putative FeS assembly SUF system protein SufT [Candidatus Endolissoclinum faulkneri L5]
MNYYKDLQHFMPGTSRKSAIAHAGRPLLDSAGGSCRVKKEVVIEAIKTVYDPEIPINLYDLGLIYSIKLLDSGSVSIEMTLTAPACPVAGELPQLVANAVSKVSCVGEVEVLTVWNPPWSKKFMSKDAQLLLDTF